MYKAIIDALTGELFADAHVSAAADSARAMVKARLCALCEERIAAGESESAAAGAVVALCGTRADAEARLGISFAAVFSEDALDLRHIRSVRRTVSALSLVTGCSLALAVFFTFLEATAALIALGVSIVLGLCCALCFRVGYGRVALSAAAAANAQAYRSLSRRRFGEGVTVAVAGLTVLATQLAGLAGATDTIAVAALAIAVLFLSSSFIRFFWSEQLFPPGESSGFKRYILNLLISELVFAAAIVGAFTALQFSLEPPTLLPWTVFLILLALFIFVFLWINAVRVKKYYTARPQSRRTLAIISLALAVFAAALGFMRAGSWWIQPTISLVKSVRHRQFRIDYDGSDGTYSIAVPDGTDFKILQLTDIHLGGSVFSFRQDMEAINAVRELVERTEPDLVVVTGDVVYPVGISSYSFNNYTPMLQFATLMRNLGIPWAFTYGNHDTESIATHSSDRINNLLLNFSGAGGELLYSGFSRGITGRSNDLIKLVAEDGSLIKPIYLLDSNAYTSSSYSDYDCIHDDQVNWLTESYDALGANTGALVFFHIPLTEYADAAALLEAGDSGTEYVFGSLGESICCSSCSSSLFSALASLGGQSGCFCGHDHLNNLSVVYRGVQLTYGMSIDYLAYSGIERKTAQRGATLITVSPDSSFIAEQVPLVETN